MNRSLSLLAAASTFALSTAFAGEITGTVTDAAGDIPLRGAEIFVASTGQRVTTERDGSFRVTGLDAGRYDLIVSYAGAQSQTVSVELSSDSDIERAEIRLGDADVLFVRGQRGQLNSAIAQQRAADGIVTVLSADDIGQLPDENVAEAARRALGVSIANDQGEGRFISIRGINSQLNATNVNGVRLTSPEAGDRRIGMDVIDADILKNIIINKTLSADMDGDAIGGSISLETVSGLDREDRLVKLKIGGIYTDFTDDTSPKLSGTYIDNFMDGSLGVALSASYQSREFASDNREVDGEWVTDDVLPYPEEELEYRNYDIERERLSLSANIDYMLTDQTRIYLNSLYNSFSDQEFRSRLELKIEDVDVDFPVADVVRFSNGGDEDIEFDRDIKDRLEEQQIYSFVTGFEHNADVWTFDGSIAFTHAEEEEPDRLDADFDYDFQNTVNINVANPMAPRLGFSPAAQAEFLDAANWGYDGIEATDGLTEDNELALTFNAQKDMTFGQYPGFLKSGVKARLREKSYDLDFRAFEPTDDLTLAQFETSVDFPIALFGPTPDPSLIREFFNANPNGFEEDLIAGVEESGISSFDASEDIVAGYVMGQVDINRLRITAGVRVEHTSVEATGNVFSEAVADDLDDAGATDFSSALTPVSFSDEYTDVLPSIQARFDLTDNAVIRASYYASIVRPNFGQFVPAGGLNDDQELEAGNPDLKRTKAHNFDLLAEYYPSKSSVIQGGIFYKDLTDFISGFETSQPGNLRGVDFEELASFTNLDEGSIFGIELGYQQALDFLPYGLDGLLVGLNYTYTDSEATLADGSTIQLPGQSENIFNAIIGYEKGPLNLRLAYSYKDDNIDDVSVDGISDGRVVLEQEFLDFSAKYAFTENVRAYFDATNILDTPLEVSNRVDGRDFLNQFEEYGIRYQFGVLFRF
ncbi:MAG: TonB-dependent receptor [Parvularculaceae bacterium]|nr:TonB-dependent receptor [Parvularculaceae bacterium]